MWWQRMQKRSMPIPTAKLTTIHTSNDYDMACNFETMRDEREKGRPTESAPENKMPREYKGFRREDQFVL